MKHAYIIVTNSLSEVFLTSIKMLDDKRNDIYVLVDKKANILFQTVGLKDILHFSNMTVCEQTVNWGGIPKLMQSCVC